MNRFVLAFPIPVGVAEPFKITDVVSVSADAKNLLVPVCNVRFDVVRNAPAAGLSDIFKEHREISAEEASAIDSHKSLLFLLGSLKSADELRMVNTAILKVLAAGATGVYMQQSGTAWTADGFREELDDGEYPMDTWINFVEAGETLYTLGMATFMLPDLCVATSVENPQQVLLLSADSLFGDGIPAKSGSEIEAEDGDRYVLRAEAKSPFPKDAPEYNKQGVLRLVKK